MTARPSPCPLVVGLLPLLVVGVVGCRSDRERGPRDESTAVGNPGDMTISLGPAPVALRGAHVAVEAIRVQGCAGDDAEIALETGAIDLTADPPVRLPLPQTSAGICGIEIIPASAIALEGVLDDGREMGALADVGPVSSAVALDAVEGVALELTLGAAGWLRLDWLPTSEEVWIGPANDIHDAMVDRLGDGLRITDRATGATVGQASSSPAPTQPDAVVGVGELGHLVLSFDGGVSWPVDLSEEEGAPADGLEAVVVVADHAEGARAVAVGGDTQAHALVITPGPELAVAEPVDRPGLRDVTWTGTQLVAVGESGTVTRSDAGLVWDEDPALSECDLLAVHAEGTELVAVGWQGCAWHSDDGGMSWEALPDLPDTGRDVVWFDGAWVVASEDGTLSWASDPTRGWSATDLGDSAAVDMIVDDATLRVIGAEAVHSTTDLIDVRSTPGGDFVQWVGGGPELLAMTAAGDLFAAPPATTDGLLYWEPRGSAPRSAEGALPVDLAVWLR